MLVKDTGTAHGRPSPCLKTTPESDSEEHGHQSHLQCSGNTTSATHRRFTRSRQGTPAQAGGGNCSSLPSWSGIWVFNLFTHLPKSLQSSLPPEWKFPLLGFWGPFPSVHVGSANGGSSSIRDSAAVRTAPRVRMLLLSQNKWGTKSQGTCPSR